MKMSKISYVKYFFLIKTTMLTIYFCMVCMHVNAQELRINEMMASNAFTIADEDGDYEDWIELFNSGSQIINLEGFGLSDNYDNPFKWVFPDISIEPGAYLLVWASGKDRKPLAGGLCSGLVREVYTGIPGWTVDDLINHPKYPDHPDSRGVVRDFFEAPINIGDHYGQRMMGWIKAPVSGSYRFWISSDDHSNLYLSTSSDPEDAVMIANVPGWTQPRQWNKYPQQQSVPITLQAGEYYYVKALMKEHEGGDNLAVGWELPDGTMQRPIPGEHLFNDQGQLHTNFSISAAGEEVFITNPAGEMLDEVTPTAIPTDISYGRSPDGIGGFYFFDEPTPGQSNTTQSFSEVLEQPLFSFPGGFYPTAFDLTITHPDPDVTIIYTIDGSDPDIENLSGSSYQYKNRYPQNPGQPPGPFLSNTFYSHIYNGSILITDRSSEPDKLTHISSTWHFTPTYFPGSPVKKGIPVRAIAVKEDAIPSRPLSHTYFISDDEGNPFELPVVSITTQEDHLYDYEQGIYVAGIVFDSWRAGNSWQYANGGSPANYWRRGEEWEYPANMEIFSKGGNHADLNHGIGLRIHGGWSRAFPKKSLRLYARARYGESLFNYQFFKDNEHTSFNRLMLRNSGNDAPHTLFRDAAIQRIMTNLNFDTQDYQPAIVFINGEYWGIHNFRERYDKHYLARVYGIDPENIDLLEVNASVKEGDMEHYNNMRAYIANNNMGLAYHYAYIKTQMDVVNFIDYNIAQIYAGNTDWPGNNIDFWRLRTDEYIPDAPLGHDGRWRWLMFDTDFGFGLYGASYTHNTLGFATNPNGPDWPNPPWSTFLLRNLLTNADFRTSFIIRFADLLNTHFVPSHVVSIISEMQEKIEPEIPAHIHRWGSPSSLSAWQSDVNVMTNYATQRPLFLRTHLRQHFNIPSNILLELDVSHADQGLIRVNTIEVRPETPGVPPLPYPWSGIYFNGIPIEIEAVAAHGYAFSHWEGSISSTNALLNITPESSLHLKAHFVESESPEPEIIHYWHFNDLPSGTLSSVRTDFSAAGVEAGVISYPGTGSGYMDRRTHREEDPVSNLNLLMGEEENQGAVLRVRNPADTRELIFKASTTGYKDISVAFATTRTTNGANAQAFYYSVDNGSNWHIIDQAYLTYLLPSWELKTFDLSEIGIVNNNNDLLFRIMFVGNGNDGTSGNNRFDNFSVHGVAWDGEPTSTDRQAFDHGDKLPDISITAYPNPASDLLFIAFTSIGQATISLSNIHGQILKSQVVKTPGNHHIEFSTGDLSEGVYLLIVEHKNALVVERILVIKKR